METTILKANFLLIAIAILLFNSCKNKDCHKDGTCAPEYYRIRIGEPKNYLWSLPGSYWIYKNTKTGELDTQTCIGFSFDSIKVQGTLNNTSYITIEYDKIARTVKSSFDNRIYSDETIDHNPNTDSYNSGWTVLDRSSDGPGYIKPFFHPFLNGTIFGNGSSNSTCKGVDSALTIQGKTYINIAKFDIDIDYIWESGAPHTGSVYYWAKDVGLIKQFSYTYNLSWELIEYNIIK